jgi:hypothetical protein
VTCLVYVRSEEPGRVQTIGRCDDEVVIARTPDVGREQRFRFRSGPELGVLEAALRAAPEGGTGREVGQFPIAGGTMILAAGRGVVRVSKRMQVGSGPTVHVEGDQLRWLARAISDAKRFAAHRPQGRRPIRHERNTTT